MSRPAAPPRFGYERLVTLIAAYRDAMGEGAAMDRRAESEDTAMDRRAVLAFLQRELGADEALLRLRGFDRAYRQIVEGV